jgi:hypothetical protein
MVSNLRLFSSNLIPDHGLHEAAYTIGALNYAPGLIKVRLHPSLCRLR